VTAEPWPPMMLSAALGTSMVQVTPSIRVIGTTNERGLYANATSSSGRHCWSHSGDLKFIPESSVCDSSAISSRPMPVKPPNSPGVSSFPLASTTVAFEVPGSEPSATMMPPRTTTSVFLSVPLDEAVCTVAPRMRKS
jgi:hypothetical protein